MKFAIQHNLINVEELHKVKEATESYPRIFIGVIPFTTKITPEKELKGKDFIPYGSSLLTILSSNLGWKGLYFDIKTADYKAFVKNRNDMLNTWVISINEAIEFLKLQVPKSNWFMRPALDLKQFTGLVINAEEGHQWLEDALKCASSGSYKLEPDTNIVLSEPKSIQAEWRWFVVGGKVISGSSYRMKDQLRSERVTEQDMIEEAQGFADGWLPHENCVMDLALVDDELKVIEFNCLNSSGFYDHDIPAIFKAIWDYEQTQK